MEGQADQVTVAEVEGQPPAPPCSGCGYQGLELRLLNCHHSICHACLQEKINRIKSFPMVITCPECTHVVIVQSEEDLRVQQLADAAAEVERRRRPLQPAPSDSKRPRHKPKRKSRKRQQKAQVDVTQFLDRFLLKVSLLNSLAILCFSLLVYTFPPLRSPWLQSLEETYIVSVYEEVCISPVLATFLLLLEYVFLVPSSCEDFGTCLPTLLVLFGSLLGLVLTLLFFVSVTYAVVFFLRLVRKTGLTRSLQIASYLMTESMEEWMQWVDEIVR